MFKIKAAVAKTENNSHAVFIDRVDDSVIFKVHRASGVDTALREILEYVYGDCDFNYVCHYKVGIWYVYDVEVIDDVE